MSTPGILGIDVDGVILCPEDAKIAGAKDRGIEITARQTPSDIMAKLIPVGVYKEIKSWLYREGTYSMGLYNGTLEALRLIIEVLGLPSYLISARGQEERQFAFERLEDLGILRFFPEERIHYSDSEGEKITSIRELRVKYFIDDKPSFLKKLPFVTSRILFDPLGQYQNSDECKDFLIVRSWHEVPLVLMDLQSEPIAKIMDWVRINLGRLDRVTRWEGYSERTYFQSSLQHSYFLALLISFCLKIEAMHGRHLSPNLVAYALLHDLGEGVTGDVTYAFKSDPLVRDFFPIVEARQTRVLLEELAVFGPFFRETYSGNKFTEEEKRFFEAMERVDYLLYAITEFFIHRHTDFVKVFYRQIGPVGQYAKEFFSVRLWLAAMENTLRRAIKDCEEYLSSSKAAVREPTKEDIAIMEQVLQRLKAAVHEN